jgi:hypothetical protein
MSEDRAKRIATLSSRFTPAADADEAAPAQPSAVAAAQPSAVAAAPPARTRGRHTFYLDSGLVARLDRAYRDAAHELYPVEVNKSDYLEAVLTYALERAPEVKAALRAQLDES